MLVIRLKRNRDRSVIQGNPWIFSGSIDDITGDGPPGSLGIVTSAEGTRLGCGYCNPHSAITVRLLRRGDAPCGENDVTSSINTAVARRDALLCSDTDSLRLINAEGDFLPGLIVDKYGPGLVVQIQTAGMELMRATLLAALTDACRPAFIYERSDQESRRREGLAGAEGLCAGALPAKCVIRENGLTFLADIAGGQKTGFFFDQRDNRRLLRRYTAGKTVGDCFSYSGGFTVAALAGGALHVDAVDRSESALGLLAGNVAVNGYDAKNVTTRAADVFRFLREEERRYDCIILDPPKFARHPGEAERASRGYKDINLLACKRVAPGGVIFTFSCSNAIDSKLFRQIVFAAAADSGRRFQLLHTLSAGVDHPVNLAHKEGEYLKGLVLRAEAG